MPTRRQVFAATGLAVATSGCISVLGDDTPEASAQAAENPESVRLEELAVQNNHGEAHEVQLAVEADGDVLHLGTYDLEGDGVSTTVDGNWNREADSYRIHARLDDAEIRTADVTNGIKPDATCVRVLLRIDETGNLAIWNGADCTR